MIGFALGFVVVLLISHKNVEGGSIYINLTRSTDQCVNSIPQGASTWGMSNKLRQIQV